MPHRLIKGDQKGRLVNSTMNGHVCGTTYSAQKWKCFHYAIRVQPFLLTSNPAVSWHWYIFCIDVPLGSLKFNTNLYFQQSILLDIFSIVSNMGRGYICVALLHILLGLTNVGCSDLFTIEGKVIPPEPKPSDWHWTTRILIDGGVVKTAFIKVIYAFKFFAICIP